MSPLGWSILFVVAICFVAIVLMLRVWSPSKVIRPSDFGEEGEQ